MTLRSAATDKAGQVSMAKVKYPTASNRIRIPSRQCRNPKQHCVQHVETHDDEDDGADELKDAPIAREALQVLEPTHGKGADRNRHRTSLREGQEQNHAERH